MVSGFETTRFESLHWRALAHSRQDEAMHVFRSALKRAWTA